MANTTKVGTIALEFPVTVDDIDSIMTTAFEGGITYWCYCAKVVGGDYRGAAYAAEVISRDGALDLLYQDGDARKAARLTLERFMDGLRLYATKRGGLPLDANGIDTGQIDVVQADLIVQYAIFGEAVFG